MNTLVSTRRNRTGGNGIIAVNTLKAAPAALTARVAADKLFWDPLIRGNNIRVE